MHKDARVCLNCHVDLRKIMETGCHIGRPMRNQRKRPPWRRWAAELQKNRTIWRSTNTKKTQQDIIIIIIIIKTNQGMSEPAIQCIWCVSLSLSLWIYDTYMYAMVLVSPKKNTPWYGHFNTEREVLNHMIGPYPFSENESVTSVAACEVPRSRWFFTLIHDFAGLAASPNGGDLRRHLIVIEIYISQVNDEIPLKWKVVHEVQDFRPNKIQKWRNAASMDVSRGWICHP